jgi:CRISPR system Cascade subunit CasA
VTFNLLEQAWIPVRRHSRTAERIAPWEVPESHGSDPIVGLDTVRPDFQGAMLEFLIGLFQTACPPEEGGSPQWVDWFLTPPSAAELRGRLEPFKFAFNLDGDGARFMQDLQLREEEYVPISGLLIDAPGAHALANNADFFVKRGRVTAMCPACVATALFALQTYAPAGGAGHRTSVRGGGPLTTLVLLDPIGAGQESSLWRTVWLNVLNRSDALQLTGNPALTDRADVFPWLASTRTSERGGRDTHPQHAHPLQMYWGMPRRIRIDWDATISGICELCGDSSERLVQRYSARNHGVKYTGGWQHPLSPHRLEQDGTSIPLHPRPGGITYRHWLSLVDEGKGTRAARVVVAFQAKKPKEVHLRLMAFGYDMDNMKPRCWYEATFPLYVLPESERDRFREAVERLVDGAAEAAGYVRSCVKEAWFSRPADVRGDSGFLVEAFFQRTETRFFQMADRLARSAAEAVANSLAREWHGILCSEALEMFDYWAALAPIELEDPRRIAVAQLKLRKLLFGKLLKTMSLIDTRRKAA